MINADEKHGDIFELLVEGTDFRAVLATREVDGIRTKFATAFIDFNSTYLLVGPGVTVVDLAKDCE